MDFFLFFIKSGIIIIVIWLFYKFVLEHESFYSANRIFFLVAILFVFVLPFIPLPHLVNHQGFVSEYLIDFTSSKFQPINIDSDNISKSKEKSNFRERGFLFWLASIYVFGFVVLLLNLITQVLSISIKAISHADKIVNEEWTIINKKGQVEPSSFFRYIFINPSAYVYETYEQILAHEKIHVHQKHSVDILLSELVICFQWFNPFAWLLKKEIEKNLEYQTDQIFLNQNPSDKESYQLNLLKVASYKKPLSVVTNYNQSLIQQRIRKINSKKSNNQSYWKYAFVFPIVFTSQLALNQPIQLIGPDMTIRNNVKDENEYNCADLLAAAKAQQIEEVAKLIVKMDPSCLKNSVQQDYDNIEFAKFLVKHNAEVTIDLWNEKINIEGYQLQIINAVEDADDFAPLVPTDGLKIHSDCEELDLAISKGEKEKVRQFLLDLDENCLIDPTPATLDLLESKKKLIRNGAEINLARVKVIIPFEDLMQ